MRAGVGKEGNEWDQERRRIADEEEGRMVMGVDRMQEGMNE